MPETFQVVMSDYRYDSIAPIREGVETAGAAFAAFQCATEAEVIEAARDADVLVTHFAPITAAVIRSLNRCRLIVRGAVGVDNIDVAAAKARGIPVANVPDYGRGDVADHVIMLLLALNKKLPVLSAAVKRGAWDFNAAKPIHRLEGRALGLLGFGGIARLVAAKSRAFSMQVLAHDPYVDAAAIEAEGAEAATLEEVLRRSDYLSLHLPLHEGTRHLLNRERLAQVKPGCVLINTARGGLVDEAALVEALESGRLGGAGLDVLAEEAVDANHPLCRIDSVILTPHSAWYSEESVETLLRSVAEEAVRALRGEPIRNPVW